ncbi:MAG: sulfatase-like hydrolase/transferase [Candidatus Sumerlaeota bacterium]
MNEIAKINRRRFLGLSGLVLGGLTLGNTFGQNRSTGTPGSRPNIILIMCDDAGFADFAYSGGISDTPVLDKMASEGMRFTRAFSNARCMPTRASLMTGLNPQLPGWNSLSGECVTIPEVLKKAGYANYMIGKWHLGSGKKVERQTGLVSTPTGRGFDRFYGIWDGAAPVSKKKLIEAVDRKMANDGKGFAPRIIEDGRELPWEQVPEDYYNTTTWTDKAVEYIRSTPDDQPFFLYAAYTAPHWPLDPQPEYVERYRGRFDEGWDVLRARIHKNMKNLGIISEDYPLPPREHGIPAFTPGTQEADKFTRGCETYYASITEMDEQIGRLLETVKETGRGENTLVVFFSDNGADNVIGGPPRGNMCNMPFMGYKLTYYEGGAATPLLAWWPGVGPADTINHGQQVMLEDYMATFVELAGAEYPRQRLGQEIHPMQGRSFLEALRDPAHADPQRTWCWAHDGQRGVWQGDWKAIMTDKRHPAVKGYYDGTLDGWYLFKIDPNRVETPDVSKEYPDKMKEMIETWKAWAKSVQWQPSPRFGLHPSDAANGITSYVGQ